MPAEQLVRRSERLAEYRGRLERMTNARLVQECGMRILDAAVMARFRSNDGWCDDQADACYDEARRRGNPDLYQRGYNSAVRSQGHDGMVGDVSLPVSHGEPENAMEKAL